MLRLLFFLLLHVCSIASVTSNRVRDMDKLTEVCTNEFLSGSVYVDNGQFVFKPTIDNEAVAYGSFLPCVNQSGWDFLNIESNSNVDAITQAKGLGFLEGVLSAQQIGDFYVNSLYYTFPNGKVDPDVVTFFNTQRDWATQTAENNCPDSILPYKPKTVSGTDNVLFWCNARYILAHLDGILSGYSAAKPSGSPTFSWAEFQVINAGGDIDYVMQAVGVNSKKSSLLKAMHNSKGPFNRCSGLVALLEEHRDLAIGHSTWYAYETMNRVYKTITSFFDERLTVSQSSYPGSISSVDDWYISTHGLVIIETSLTIFNSSLFDGIVPQSLPAWLRSVVAARISRNGQQWTEYYKIHHSGTYPNQWIILDTKLFVDDGAMIPGLLWVSEDMPGYFVAQDQTDFLRKNKYWPSYNVPFYPEIFQISGSAQNAASEPEYASYTNCSRAKIFARDTLTKVVRAKDGEKGFRDLLRYNNYEFDSISDGDPAKSIAARLDLETDGYANAYGAIDTKFTSIRHLKESPFFAHIISSPTHDNLPAFAWNANFAGSHVGQPTVFDFNFVSVDEFSGRLERNT